MRFGSLFAGMGGGDKGLEDAGMECAAQVEADPACNKVLAKHWPHVPRLGRIEGVRGGDIGAVDLLIGGFPCQDLSVAGRRAGLAGERSGLFFQFARLIEECAPRWVVIENVPGLLSSARGRDMAIILGTLAKLRYGWAYRVLDAQYFGVPQRRRRVFIVGCLGDPARAAAVLFEPESLFGNPPPRDREGEGTSYSLTSRAPGGRLEREATYVIQDASMPRAKKQNGLGITEGGPMYSLDGHGAHGIAQPLRAGRQYSDMGDGQANVIPVAMNFHENLSGNVTIDGTAKALRSGASKSYQGIQQGLAVRRLTPLECLRLQGFPDDWFDGLELSDSQKYRMCGNAMAVPVVAWIGRRIMVNRHGAQQ